MTKAALEQSWGRAYGVCKGCPQETWYFNYYAFQPSGAGVEVRAGKVAAIFTLYQPAGWHTNRGLRLGDSETRITSIYGALVRRQCVGYSVLDAARGALRRGLLCPGQSALGFRAVPARTASLPRLAAANV